MAQDVQVGTTGYLKDIFIPDSTKTDGSGLAGLTNSSGGLILQYHRQGDAAGTQVGSTGALAALTVGTFTSGGFAAVTGMPAGTYQIGIPNACFNATGQVVIALYGATNAMPVILELQVVAYNPNSASNLGLTNLDAAVTSRMATYTQPTGFLAATFPGGTVANTTNITAGTITTATTATNVTTVSAGGITAASFAAWAEGYTVKGTGSSYTPDKLLWDIHQRLYSTATVTTVIHVKKIDNSTDAHTLTMDDATAPTAETWTA